MDWSEIVFQIAITISITAFIKAMIKKDIGEYSKAIAMGVAFIVVLLAVNGQIASVTEFIKQSLYVGLGATGFYKVADKIANG